MLIAQITDIHLGFDPGNPTEFNRKRLDQTLNRIRDLEPQPDLLLMTGDLADKGDSDSYRRLKTAIGGCDFPVWPCMGNHDDREAFAEHFSDIPTHDGFVQYVVDDPDQPVRVIVLDTLEPGRHGGAFCETRAEWLKARLTEETEKPTAVILHHPPIETGIDWMTADPDANWIRRLREAMEGATNVVGMIAGHIHRPITTIWNGFQLSVCPSTAPQVALDLRDIDPEKPDKRPMIVADAPAFALHYWNGLQLITHWDDADDHVELARFDQTMQPLIRFLKAERAGKG